jgi:succinate dehydrogenase hydrophobic anchor subunit
MQQVVVVGIIAAVVCVGVIVGVVLHKKNEKTNYDRARMASPAAVVAFENPQ